MCLLLHPFTLLASGSEGLRTVKALEEELAKEDIRR